MPAQSPESDTRFCAYCGAPNPSDFKFCAKCGHVRLGTGASPAAFQNEGSVETCMPSPKMALSIARKTFIIAAVATAAVWVLAALRSRLLVGVYETAVDFGIWIILGSGVWYLWLKRKQPRSPVTVKRVLFYVALGLCGFYVLGSFINSMERRSAQEAMQAKQRAANNHCPEAAKIVTLMLAKDGYHVTRPSGAAENTVALIGSTDMTEGTVEEVKAALGAEHDTLMHLRAAGCAKIGFYGDKFGPLGKEIDLDELP